jgi:outer membrane receptor protein involved in Fe transport
MPRLQTCFGRALVRSGGLLPLRPLLLWLIFMCALSNGWTQPFHTVHGTVIDPDNRPIAGARLVAGRVAASADAQGRFALSDVPNGVVLRVTAPGFRALELRPGNGPLRIVLSPAAGSERVLVTASRLPLAPEDSPASMYLLSPKDLRDTASPALDDKLRQAPGFDLFRRTSSLVANPTAQGVSLRGLGSTAASRTLVLSDEEPLNDPFGGWIHWDEIPELAVDSVDLVRGGASDLYGSSAIGGVIDVNPVLPTGTGLEFLSSYGSFNTLDDALLLSGARGLWSGMATGGILRTDGYILVAPQDRGPVDVAANSHAENGRLEIDRALSNGSGRLFLRGNVLNEARGNGTPVTSNGTRLWRYEGGGDWDRARAGAFLLRVYGSDEHFRQTFSAVAPGRASEKLTRFAQTPTEELGGAFRWTKAAGTHLLFLAGADARDIRGSDREIGFLAPPSSRVSDLSARQRQTGIYGEVLWTPEKWTISLSGRFDHFSNFDARQYLPLPRPEPGLTQSVFDPRLGLMRHLNANFAFTGSVFRAFRAPTENELYRTGQVGQATTLANSNLAAERATGWETGVLWNAPALPATVRASYFWTEVNRPVTALTLNVTPTAITLQRENLGQIRSRGVSLDGDARLRPWLSAHGGYQYADATVTRFAPDPSLVGTWIPQVPHNVATANLRAFEPQWGTLSAAARMIGRQYDDDKNLFLLHGFFELDLYASHSFGRFEVFGAGENVLNRTIEVGRTPVLTLGRPQAVRVGLRWHLGEVADGNASH